MIYFPLGMVVSQHTMVVVMMNIIRGTHILKVKK